jgi:hypothetical protein
MCAVSSNVTKSDANPNPSRAAAAVRAIPRIIGKFRIGNGTHVVATGWDAASVAVLFAHTALLVLVVHPSAAPRVLHYTTVFGIDLIGAGTRLYLLPAVGFVVLVMNRILGRILRSDASASLVPLGSLVVQLSLATATLSVVRINLP